MPDWAFTTIGWSLAALALAAVLYAWLADAPRGRARCPKCWYDLRGQLNASPDPPWTCPECGRAITRRRQAYRSRVRYRYLALAAILALASYATIYTPDIRARGWWVIAPRPVLLYALATMPPTNVGPNGELPPWAEEAMIQYVDHPPLFWWPGESLMATFAAREVFTTDIELRKNIVAAILARVCRDPLYAAGDQGAAYAILAKMQRVYAEARTYRDVSLAITSLGHHIVQTQPSDFAFSRVLQAFRAETSDSYGYLSRSRGTLLMKSGTRTAMWYGTELLPDPSPSPFGLDSMQLRAGSNSVVYKLLQNNHRLTDSYPTKSDTDVIIDGARCYRVTAIIPRPLIAFEGTLCIDRESFLIRAIYENSADVITATKLKPEINQPLSPTIFELPITTLRPPNLYEHQEIMDQFPASSRNTNPPTPAP